MSNISTFIASVFLSFFIVLPVFAQGGASPTISADCTRLSQNFTEFGGRTPGPLAANCYSPGQAVARATQIGFGLAGALTILFMVIGGYQYMTSTGDDKKAESGKKTIKWAVIGLGLVLFAYAIVTVVVRLATTGSVF